MIVKTYRRIAPLSLRRSWRRWVLAAEFGIGAGHQEVRGPQQRNQVHAACRDHGWLEAAQQQVGGRGRGRRQGAQPGRAQRRGPEAVSALRQRLVSNLENSWGALARETAAGQ